jgi:hypothetical protein
MTVITRRTVLTGAAAATAVGTVNVPVASAGDDKADLASFIDISVALTGIAQEKLAPDLDPINIKQAYFEQAQKDPAFDDLLARWRNRPAGAGAEVFFTQRDPVRYLARNIIIAWYLGGWCKTEVLESYDVPNPPPFPIPFTVINAAAYTQGWAWRVAQAHPMGYSELRFGYWADKPFALPVLIGSKK